MIIYFITKYCSLLLFGGLFIGIINNRNNVLLLFFFFELLLLIAGLGFIINSLFFNTITGFILFIYVVTLAAIKTAIGVSLIVLFVKHCNTLNCFKV